MNVRDHRVDDTLKNGISITVRAIRPDDRERLLEAFGKLEPETIYKRFFGYKKALTEDELQRVIEVDFDSEVVLVVTTGEGEHETVIGAARYVRVDRADHAGVAEVSFLVEEDYQGLGIASRLLRQLAAIARARGITRFDAEVLAVNRPMLAVFARSGLPMRQRREEGVVRVALELDGKRQG